MKISDVIEKFIIDIIGDADSAEISRNELASYFHCAPSQINYVLATRFTLERGYRVTSRRGGGGFIGIERFDANSKPYLNKILETLAEPVSYTRSKQIIQHLVEDAAITREEGDLLDAATCEKALSAPANISDSIRSNILRETIIRLLKR